MNKYLQTMHSAYRKKSKPYFPCRAQKLLGITIVQHIQINLYNLHAMAYADKIKNLKEMAIYVHIK